MTEQPTNNEAASDFRTVVKGSSTVVWVVLMAATCASWWLGTDHTAMISNHQLAGAVVLVIAFAKVYLIGRDFMHLRESPRALSTVFNGWVVGVGAIVVGIYLML